MFYNSKKLIDEKVLQQYYFECFMLADGKERQRLLPPRFRHYAPTKAVKGLNPEVRMRSKVDGSEHVTDFQLYPMPNSRLKTLNVEIKWDVSDFQKQRKRYQFYDGREGDGYVVAMAHGGDCMPTVEGTEIPVVYLEPERFMRWFSRKSHSIVSQTLANKLGIPPARLSGEKFWVVSVVSKSFEHYLQHGRPHGVWAFRDNNSSVNIMNILTGDYVVFVHLDHCAPGRSVYPHSLNPNRRFEKSRGGFLKSSDVSWAIDMVDIRRVKQGFHLNYTDKPLYSGFDEAWMSSPQRLPEDKDYTQFITFEEFDASHPFSYQWNKPSGSCLDRSLFSEDSPECLEFVNALRVAMNTRGDAIELSRPSFESLLQIVAE